MDNAGDAPSPSSGGLTVSVEQLQFMCVTKAFAKTVIAPLDRVKYMLQCQGELMRLGRIDTFFSGARGCMQHVHALEGPRSFWRGNLVQVGGILPTALAQAFIALPTQRIVFDLLPHATAGSYTVASFASGIAGAAASSIVSYPLDFARFRMAVDMRAFPGCPYEFRHSMDLFSHPAMLEAPHNAYRGLSLYIAGSLLYRSVYLSVFQLVVPYLPTDEQCERSKAAMAVQVLTAFGMVSVATLWLYPLDTVRRRMMLAVTHDEGQYLSAAHCFRTILKAEGPAGFFRGAGFTVCRGALTTGLAMLIGINF